jgi:hypothetical protein
MLKIKLPLLVLLSFMVFVPRANAQYRWHIIHPDRFDSVYYFFASISCSGESCSVVGVNWLFGKQNSNFIFHSSDGGQTWNLVDSALPQWAYTWDSKSAITLNSIMQIDSLAVIAVGNDGTVVRTFDGWNTWQSDTFNFPPVVFFHDTSRIILDGIDFANVGEGVLSDASDDVNFRTVDTGKHWLEELHCGNMHPYGNGMFREYRAGYNFNDPDTIITTFTWDGPFLKGDLSRGYFYFGAGDTLFNLAFRYDSTGINQIATIVRSSDLGANWIELPVPRTNRISNSQYFSDADCQTMVIAGQDSTGEILLSTDRGAAWELDTVPLANSAPYSSITSLAITGSGRIIASIRTDSNVEISSVLAYLEKVASGFKSEISSQDFFSIFPNPATNDIQITTSAGNISILDPLGPTYEAKRTGNTLDVSALPSGVYFISDGHSRAKFVKE